MKKFLYEKFFWINIFKSRKQRLLINNSSNIILLYFLYFFFIIVFKKIIRSCEQIDSSLESFGVEKNYWKIYLEVLKTLIITSVKIITIISLHNYITFNEKEYDLSILLYIPITTMYLGTLTFTIFIR